jgi:hypothetical protein
MNSVEIKGPGFFRLLQVNHLVDELSLRRRDGLHHIKHATRSGDGFEVEATNNKFGFA